MTQFVLTAGSNTLDLSPANTWTNGIAISQKDLGAPVVREVTYDRASQDGTDDQTLYLSQRVISITGKCFSQPGKSRQVAWTALQPFLDPAARATLTYLLDDDQPAGAHQMTNLRLSQYTKMASSPMAYAFQIQWKADPVALTQSQSSVSITPFSGTQGRTYPRTFPMVYPYGPSGSGIVTVVSNGSYKTWPIYRIYGPCTNPVIAMLTQPTGTVLGEISLNLGIPGGQYVEIQTIPRTVMLGGPGGSSRYSSLNFTQTTWVPMTPGNNTFRFTASSATAPASCSVLWNDAYL